MFPNSSANFGMKAFNTLPGPSKLSILRGYCPGGKLRKVATSQLFRQTREEFGDIFVLPSMFARSKSVVIFDPEDIQKVYRTEGKYPIRRAMKSIRYHRNTWNTEHFQSSTGLLGGENESWSRSRTAINPLLVNPKNLRMYIPKLEQTAKELIACIRRKRDSKTNKIGIDFEYELNKWSMESVALVALDTKLNLLVDPELKHLELIANVNEFVDLAYKVDVKPSIWQYCPTPNFYKVMNILDKITNQCSEFIDKARTRNMLDKTPSVLEQLLDRDPDVATVLAMDMLFAGVHTTSVAMISLLLNLAKNPDKQEILRREIYSIDGEYFTDDNIKHLKYARACIKECIRMCPVVPMGFRQTGQDTVLSNYEIPKGTDIIIPFEVLMTDEKYFYSPDQFIPERWIRPIAGQSQPNHNPFVYTPFSFGARACIGQRLTYLEMEILLIYILKNFQIHFDNSIEKAFKTTFLKRVNIPLNFTFSDI